MHEHSNDHLNLKYTFRQVYLITLKQLPSVRFSSIVDQHLFQTRFTVTITVLIAKYFKSHIQVLRTYRNSLLRLPFTLPNHYHLPATRALIHVNFSVPEISARSLSSRDRFYRCYHFQLLSPNAPRLIAHGSIRVRGVRRAYLHEITDCLIGTGRNEGRERGWQKRPVSSTRHPVP